MQKVMKLIILFSFLLIQTLESFNNFTSYLGLYRFEQQALFSTERLRSEGFPAGTQIAIPMGFKSIEDLNQGDFISSYDEHSSTYEQTITAVFSTESDQYVAIVTDDEIINAGTQQKFYSVEKNKWVPAEHLQLGEHLLKNYNQECLILSVEKVNRTFIFYHLTTSNHIFYVTRSRICVHNDDATTIALGCLLTMHPIISTLGITLAVGAGAHLLYTSLAKPADYFLSSAEENLPANNVFPELPTYEKNIMSRKKAISVNSKMNFFLLKTVLKK